MKITFADGIYYATFKSWRGRVCMGYSPVRLEAIEYCAALIIEKREVTA